MILTTSRRPCLRSRNLCKELQAVIPLSEYIIRGEKGLRELLAMSLEKGAERVVITTSKGEEPFSLVFYAEWNFLGELPVTVMLRREMGIPKVPPLEEDVPFLLKSSETKGPFMADLLGAELYSGNDAYAFTVFQENVLNFYRLDVSENPVGPRIQVTYENEYENKN